MVKKTQTDEGRFRAAIRETEAGCWEWQQTLDRDGYAAQWKIGSRTDGSRRAVRPHRWAYEHFVGPIGHGLQIDHLCRNRACCNPAHLEPVTGRENTQRGARKNQTHCKRGHPLSGENLRVNSRGYRSCKTCQGEHTKAHYRKSGGASQKKYAEANAERRRLAQAARREAWSPERREQERQRMRAYDLRRRPRKAGGEDRPRG